MRFTTIWCLWFSLVVVNNHASAQIEQLLDGQLSGVSSFNPKATSTLFVGVRYLPEYSLNYTGDSNAFWDFNVAGNLSAGAIWRADSVRTYASADPYRAWARFSTSRLELRAGLQKIDFGVAKLVRPLQWFNQIDPRDPLQLTNGVYSLLGRYYFANNANIWLWSLYGNRDARGFDLFGTRAGSLEAGGRFQWPLPTGEAALSYHYRQVGGSDILNLPSSSVQNMGEDRLGLDVKVDRTVGLAFESAFIRKRKRIQQFTETLQVNCGVDYTFGIGNGLGILIEQYGIAFMERGFENRRETWVTAGLLTYPFSLFDQLQFIVYQPWVNSDPALILNYQHTFKRIVAYTMLYYNPESTGFVQQNDLTNQFQGPGIRILIVYNH
jgi:hypothetical protein